MSQQTSQMIIIDPLHMFSIPAKMPLWRPIKGISLAYMLDVARLHTQRASSNQGDSFYLTPKMMLVEGNNIPGMLPRFVHFWNTFEKWT